MALKDWKELSYNSWAKGKLPNRTVITVTDATRFPSDKDYVVIKYKSSQLISKRYFKTKQQALKYARAYMRKH